MMHGPVERFSRAAMCAGRSEPGARAGAAETAAYRADDSASVRVREFF